MPYTTGENMRRGWLAFRGLRQASAGVDPSIDNEFDRIQERKDQRRQDDYEAFAHVHATARREVAALRTKVRTSRGPERRAAQDELRAAEKGKRRIEGDARKAGFRF